MAEDDPLELSRFVAAQGLVFETVLAERRAGRKETHWVWFIFPQQRALGSPTANLYVIGSIEEARAYLDIPCLPKERGRSMRSSGYLTVRPWDFRLARRSEIPLVDDVVQRSCRGGRGTIPAGSGAFLCRRTRSS